MLQNAYFLAKIGADTAENEQHFAEILPKIDTYPTGPWPPPPAGGLVVAPGPRREVNNSLIIVNFFHKIQNFRQISDLFSQI